jgi:hypothetical protein|tara:strand:- start:19 stop:300 length:282 start_codon:yes stop_codon:yes gene_type:complete
MNTKFTKGEWFVNTTGTKIWIDTETGLTVAEFFYMENHPHNANLMASAPDMYAMIKEVADMQKQWHGHWMDTHIKLAKMAKKMELILAKARGE